MAEYLAPGVYVEERSFRSKSIEGVSTSTTAFVGPTLFGPTEGVPELITNFGQFERIYGGLDPLKYGDEEMPNYLAHGVRAFFDNGGARLYVARAYKRADENDADSGKAIAPIPTFEQDVLKADIAARESTVTVLTHLATAVTELEYAKAAAIMLLEDLAGEVVGAIPGAVEGINFDYGTDAPVSAQLTAIINGLTENSPERNAAEAARTDEVNERIVAAEIEYDRARNGLGTAADTKAAAIMLLEDLAGEVVGAIPGAVEGINFDYGTDAPVSAQLTAIINGLTENSPERNAAEAARTDEVNERIVAAEIEYDRARNGLGAADTKEKVENAYENGETSGGPSEIPDTALPTNSTAGITTVVNLLGNETNNVVSQAGELAALSASLAGALKDRTIDTLDTVVTGTQALITAALEVEPVAMAAAGRIAEAAELATIGRRATIKNAQLNFWARFPGAAGNLTVTVTGRLGANVLSEQGTPPQRTLRQVRPGDLVVIQIGESAALIYHATRVASSWSFEPEEGQPLSLSNLTVGTDKVYPLTLSVVIEAPGKFAQPMLWTDLTVSSLASRSRDSITQVFAQEISNRLQALETPLVSEDSNLRPARLAGFLIGLEDWQTKLANPNDPERLFKEEIFTLTGGSDGTFPDAEAYKGKGDNTSKVKSGLKSLEDIEDISIVAAPGYSYSYDTRETIVRQINQELITHCENMRYRVAVLDSPNSQSLSQVQDYRAVMDSTHAAVYYPWVRILDPVSERPIDVPPSGFLAGIYARNDNENGVHKAPANEVVRGAIGLETLINKGQQDILNPKGIDCLRFFEGRGFRVWGARTISSDPEWKYLNVRRYFNYLEASIDRSTQWAVFEPNGEPLWANIRRTVEDFLYNEWKEERLAGTKPESAFFVRCDRSTMTQNDLDNGRLICLIGVAPLYPAEFVIFRIGQWTADSRS